MAGEGGHGGGAAPVDLRLGGLAQPQLQPRAEQILERRPQLRPPRGRYGQVQPVGQALGRQREQPGLQVVELRAQGEVAVDDEQEIGGGLVGELTRGTAGAERLHRGDPGLAEQPLPTAERGDQLGDGAAHEIDLLPVGDRAHVRQPGERAQRAAAEVEHVHADLVRGVGEREAEDHRGEPARLARPRPADDREVPGRAGKVDDKRIAPLQVGPVDQADGHLQRDPLRGQLVQRRWRGERRQPDRGARARLGPPAPR